MHSGTVYRAEILTIFGSYFGRNDDFINSIWNILTFKSLLGPLSKKCKIHPFWKRTTFPFYWIHNTYINNKICNRVLFEHNNDLQVVIIQSICGILFRIGTLSEFLHFDFCSYWGYRFCGVLGSSLRKPGGFWFFGDGVLIPLWPLKNFFIT